MTKIHKYEPEVAGQDRGKPIEFKVYIHPVKDDTITKTPNLEPYDFDNISLIAKTPHAEGFDIMFAWNEGHYNRGCLYLGHWNGGYVE